MYRNEGVWYCYTQWDVYRSPGLGILYCWEPEQEQIRKRTDKYWGGECGLAKLFEERFMREVII